MVKEILINIGNTHAQFAVFDGETVKLDETIPTSEIAVADISTLAENPKSGIFVASVVPKVNEQIVQLWQGRGVKFLNWQMMKNVDFSKVDVSTVGADRLANISAAVVTLKLPAIIVDCGTAITTEVIDADNRFLGGAIIPGRKLWRKALNNHTGQLPEITLFDSEAQAIGTTTVEALGVMDCAVIGAVERIISKTCEKLKDANVYFTGGDAPFFVKALNGEQLPENFTLIGLAEVLKQLR